MKRVFMGGIALAALAVPAFAQTGTARGKVVDDKSQGVAEAVVTIEFQGAMTRKFDTKTNKKGEFTQVGLHPGVYRFTAAKEGFQPTYVEARISLGDPTYLPELKLVPKAVVQAAAVDKTLQELKGGFESAQALLDAGKLDEAEAAFKALAVKYPDLPQLHHNLAVVYTQKKDHAGAEAAYLKALEVKPDYAEGYVALSNLYLSTGEMQKANDLLTKGMTAMPDSGKLQFQMGFLLFNSGQTEQAEAAFKKAEALDPDNPEVQFELGRLALMTARKAECVTRLEKYLAMSPQNQQNAAIAPQLLKACKG